MFTSMHVSRTLALRPDGPTHDARIEGDKAEQAPVQRWGEVKGMEAFEWLG